MFKKRIMIDFDGVLNNYEKIGYNDTVLPDLKEGATDFLDLIYKKYDLYLFTSRNSEKCKTWLKENCLEKYFKDVTNIKIPAYLYIDDRAICFNGDYTDLLNKIDNFKVYWKQN